MTYIGNKISNPQLRKEDIEVSPEKLYVAFCHKQNLLASSVFKVKILLNTNKLN